MRLAFRPVLLGVLVLGAASPARAYDGGHLYSGYVYTPGGGYPLALPETLRATITVPLADKPAGAADTLRQLFPALAACWSAPRFTATPHGPDVQVTARLSLRRDGSLIGTPRITYAAGISDGDRPALMRATVAALGRCTPVRLTPGLGRAIAGRPMALRFVYHPPA